MVAGRELEKIAAAESGSTQMLSSACGVALPRPIGAAHDHQIGNLRAEAGTPGEQLGKVAERSDGDDDALPLGLLIEPAGEGGDRVA